MSEKKLYAYPSGRATCDVTGDDYAPEPGMELRDWFAGQALAAITPVMTDRDPHPSKPSYAQTSLSISELASTAYRVADAMLAARAQPQPGVTVGELADALSGAVGWLRKSTYTCDDETNTVINQWADLADRAKAVS